MRRTRSLTVAVLAAAAILLVAPSAHATLIGNLQQISPTPTTYVDFVDFAAFLDLGDGHAVPGEATAHLQLVPSFGDDSGDFVGFTPGDIALIERGGDVVRANFSTKANLAAAAGAVGVLIYNDDFTEPGGPVTNGVMVDPTTIPALNIKRSLGLSLQDELRLGPVVMHMQVTTPVPEPTTLTLLGVGLAGLTARARRRLRQT